MTHTTFSVPRRRLTIRVESLALDVLGDDDELLAALNELLEDRENVGDDGDLLIGDQQVSVVDDGFHLLGIGDHVRG